MKHRCRALPLVGALVLSACSQDATGPDASSPSEPQPTASTGTLVGRLETSSASASLVPLYSRSTSGASTNGITVAVARVKTDGTIEALASASAAADGSYRVEKVPAGVDRLVVVARSGTGAEIGRAIVHQALPANGSATAAPINSETTVEARVFGELVRSGQPKDAVNTIELAQSIDFGSKASAEAVASSAADLAALADAARARQQIYTEVLAGRGITLDAKARFDAALAAAATYAQERHAGADERTAEAKAASAVADAYRSKGADNRVQSEASSAAETGFLRAAQVADAQARLELARAAAKVNLLARERLTSEVLASLGVGSARVDSAKAALAQARAAADTASSSAGLAQAAARASATIQTSFEGHLSQGGRVPQAAVDRIKAALQNLPSQADLESRLSGASTPGAVASTYTAHVDAIRSAVQSAVSQFAAAGGTVDGKSTADLFTALRGRVQHR